MAQVVNVARDSFGNVIPEAEVTVFVAGTDTLATIFSDNNNTLSKPNPFNADDQGQYSFFADPGEVKIRVEKQGFEQFELDFIPVPITGFSDFQEGAGIVFVNSGVNLVVSIGTLTKINFDTLIFDDSSIVSLPNIEISQEGMYHVSGQLALLATGTSASHVDLSVTGGSATWDSGLGTDMRLRVSTIYRAAASDLIEMFITPQGGQAEVIAASSTLEVAMIYPL